MRPLIWSLFASVAALAALPACGDDDAPDVNFGGRSSAGGERGEAG